MDIGAAVKAARTLKPAVELMEATGDLAKFEAGIQALVKARKIDNEIAVSLMKTAKARAGFQEASRGLTRKLLSKVYSFPGPLADPDVYAELVKMASLKIKEGVNSFQVFYLEIKKARTLAKLGEMTPQELAKLKAAWEEGMIAANQGKYTTIIKWGIHEIDARPFGKGYLVKRIKQTDPRVDTFEMKINPHNESFYLPHPEGGFVQFENILTGAAQDGKLIMKPKSLYHSMICRHLPEIRF